MQMAKAKPCVHYTVPALQDAIPVQEHGELVKILTFCEKEREIKKKNFFYCDDRHITENILF